MNESPPLIQLPEPGAAVLWVLGMLFAGLVLLAFLLDRRRRGRARRERLRGEWASFEDVMREREASPAEAKLLKDLVTRHAAESPLRAVTVRQEFDRLVEAAMARAASERNSDAFANLGAQLREIRRLLRLDRVPYGQQLHSTRELERGQHLTVVSAAEEGGKGSRMIIESVDEAYLYLERAAVADPAPALNVGDAVRCRLWRDDDARYTFGAKVAGLEEGGRWRLAHTGHIERVQAREDFRVRFNQPAAIAVLNAPVGDDTANLRARRPVTRIRGRITSLSAGGCALVLNQLVARQVMLRINLELEDGQPPLEAEARIIALAQLSGERQLVRTAFVGLDENARERIAKFVLHRQQHVTAAHSSAGGERDA